MAPETWGAKKKWFVLAPPAVSEPPQLADKKGKKRKQQGAGRLASRARHRPQEAYYSQKPAMPAASRPADDQPPMQLLPSAHSAA